MEGLLRGARRKLARLRPVRVPDAPVRAFRDLWPGDPARGARLLRGEFEVAGTVRPLLLGSEDADQAMPWGALSAPPAWRAAALGFAWLRDLRALGTDAARLRARALAVDFLERAGDDPLGEAPEVTGARLSAMLGHWDFFAATADDQLRRQLMQRLGQDGRASMTVLPDEVAHRGALVALKGALAAAVALGEETWLARCLRHLPAELERQFLPDGGHVERSPGQHLLALQDLIEIRNLLHGSGIEAPPLLTVVMDRAVPALRLFRHGDGGIALFNGTRIEGPKEGGGALLDLVLTQAQSRGRGYLDLPDTGFYRLQAGRTLLIADCGRPPENQGRDAASGLARGADRFHHAGTLSFEISVGRERLIVNCGAAPAGDDTWRDALRSTAAHSTVTVADTNSSELREDGLGRRPDQAEGERQEAEVGGAQWLEASHDGWRRQFDVVHRRRLYLAKSGDELRGEDLVEGDEPPAFVVRFHLHPGVTATLQPAAQPVVTPPAPKPEPAEGEAAEAAATAPPPVPEGTVMLQLPSGAQWKLRARGARVELEESIYLGAQPGPTKQVAMYAAAGVGSVQWGFYRETNAPGSGAAEE